MKIVGIIAEYNPFHNGHQYHVQEALKVTGADAAVVAMSGDYVQRGAPAVMSKHLRVQMALQCGVAAVFELPVCYATGSAELFALGAVSLLDALGVDALCFGSECGDLPALRRLANILCEEPKDYRRLLKMYVKEGVSYPAARERAIAAYLKGAAKQAENGGPASDTGGLASLDPAATHVPDSAGLLGKPNNILAVEYLKALKKLNSHVTPYTVQRAFSAYHDDKLRPACSSASAIRRALEQENSSVTFLKNQVPSACMEIFEDYYRRQYPIDPDDFSLLLKYKLLNTIPEDLPLYQDVSAELANRITNMMDDYRAFTQFASLLMTRQFTGTRVNRALLHLLLDIKKTDVEHNLADGKHYYARVLGFQANQTCVVSELAKRTRLPLLTSPGKRSSDGLPKNARQMLMTDVRAANLYHSVVTDKYRTPYINELSQGLLKV